MAGQKRADAGLETGKEGKKVKKAAVEAKAKGPEELGD